MRAYKMIVAGMSVVVLASVPTAQALEGPSNNSVSQSTPVVRATERLAKQTTKPTATEVARVQDRCSSIKQSIVKPTESVASYNDPLITKYDALIQRLNAVMQQRATAGKNSSDLNSMTAEMSQKYQTYKTTYAGVKADLEDAKELDCKTQASEFSATVRQARTDLTALQSARDDLQKFTKDNVLTSLQKIKEEQ